MEWEESESKQWMEGSRIEVQVDKMMEGEFVYTKGHGTVEVYLTLLLAVEQESSSSGPGR